MPFPIAPRFRRLLADRRGATAAVFAAGVVGVFGAFALATDAGVWYAQRRGAQNAADTAASAGAMALAMSGQTVARNASLDVTSRNGFAHTTGGATSVAVNIPPSAGPLSADPTAVEVVVRQQQNMTAAALLLSTAPTVEGRSIANLRPAGNVCILALTGQLWAGGNIGITAPTCVLASNQRAGYSIDMTGNALAISAYTLSAVGQCDNCDSANIVLGTRYREYQVPVRDPYAHLQSKTLPRAPNNCRTRGNGNRVNLRPWENNGNRPYCGDIRINGGETTDLDPGTYYILNGSLFALGGGSLICSACGPGQGVTIVFTGDPGSIGGPVLSANSGVNLRAPLNPTDPDWRGILFYRDVSATTNNINNPSVSLGGTTDTSLVGGMYFPSSHVRIIGTPGVMACSVVVGASITFNGNASVSQCAEVGTTVPQAQAVVVRQ